jgi:hypothetical protein
MIQIQAPNGDIVNFPDGTPDETMTRAMRAEYGGPSTPASPSAPSLPPPAAPPPPASDYVPVSSGCLLYNI